MRVVVRLCVSLVAAAAGMLGLASVVWAAAEIPTYLGAQSRFTLDSQDLADRASLAVNVASGNLLVSAADVRIAGRGLSLGLSRTYNGRDDGDRAAGREWTLGLSSDITAGR